MRRTLLLFLATTFLAAAFLVAPFLVAQAGHEVEITDEPHHHIVLTNDQVRVFSVDVAPHTDTLPHWHRHDYIYVMLGASQVVNAVEGKYPVSINLQDAQVGFTPGNFAHVVRNGDRPFRNYTIELLQDDKLHQSASHWDEDRGLDVLQGGTREVLWVKDGVRASEYELQTGGVIPKHHHSGPHLVVALTDYELRSDVVGASPTTVRMKAGQVNWVAGGVTHIITNTGQGTAKFVTLEFP